MKENQLIEGKIGKSLLRFAFPVFLALFLQAMYGAVDLLVVGKYAKLADQSGVATGSMFMNAFNNVITCLAVGVTVMIGEAIGGKDTERTSKAIGAGTVFFALIAIVATVIFFIFAQPIAMLMNAPTKALSQTTAYIRICGGGILFIVAFNILGAVFRGVGDSKTPLITVAIACVVNIVGDFIFVLVFQMGAAGAALATVLAQAVSVVASLIMIRRKKMPFRIQKSDFRLWGSYIKKIVIVGAPIALQQLLVSFSFIFIQSTVNVIGVVESAAVGVGEKVCAFLMLVASAYMQSMAAFVAQNNGAGKQERSKKALLYGILTAMIAGAVMGLLAFFKGDMLAGIFSNEKEVITATHLYLKAYAFDCVLTAILFCFIGYYNGCENTMFVMVQGIIGAFFIRVPLVMLFNKIGKGSLFIIGLATPISSVVQIFLCIFMYYYLIIKERKVQNER